MPPIEPAFARHRLSFPQNRDAELLCLKVRAEKLGLTGNKGKYGPNSHVKRGPTADQDELAKAHALVSLEPLQRAIQVEPENVSVFVRLPQADGLRGRRARFGFGSSPAPSPIGLQAGLLLGLPLTLAFAPTLWEPISESILDRLEKAATEHELETALGLELVLRESHLWDMAAKHGGPTRLMPFACRLRALRWFHEPGNGRGARWTLCLRCGRDVITRQRRDGFPLCDRCSHHYRGLDPSPLCPSVIAPDGAGTWWLQCQDPGCSVPFTAGRVDAQFCHAHRSASLTQSKRRSRGRA